MWVLRMKLRSSVSSICLAGLSQLEACGLEQKGASRAG